MESLLGESTRNSLAEKIHHARSLSNRPLEAHFTPFANIGSVLAKWATETPDRNYLTFCGEEGQEIAFTYGEFYALARQVGKTLTGEYALQTGDRVATLLTNDWRTVLFYFGAWVEGLTVVPLNVGEDDERLAFILENAGVKVVLTNQTYAERLQSLCASNPTLNAIVTLTEPTGSTPIEEITGSSIAQEPLPDIAPNTECLIVYTSGTTGAPKGVVLEHANLLADAHTIAEWHRFGAEDRAMCVLPIHHVNGTVVTLMTPAYTGGSVVLNSRFRAQSFWQTLAEECCTWCSVVPTVLAFLTERHDDLTQYNLSRFRHIICGAGPLTVETARRFQEAFGVRVVHGYGLSETTCYSCFLPIDLDAEAFSHWMFACGFPSIGCPVSANEMDIQDAQGQSLPPDTRGEIVIRGHNVMREYFNRPDANASTFAFGWFRSGDEGFRRRGDDGRDYYFITGRIKELIIRGGVNYSPFDIDEVLNAIPGVKAAMAVGFENNFYGEEIGAYVQCEEGATVTETEILQHCREHLTFAKSPKVVVFGETFPVTSTGKYQRNQLKSLFSDWKDHQFREKR